MSFNLGTAQLDQHLLDTLTAAGVKDVDARALARMDAFGGQPTPAWLAGLRAVVALLNHQILTLDWGTVPQPWDTVGPALVTANRTGTQAALTDALQSYDAGIQLHIIQAIGAIAEATEKNASRSGDLAAGPSPVKAEALEAATKGLAPIDPELWKRVQRILVSKPPRSKLLKQAGEQVLDWMMGERGFFIHTTHGEKYYLYRPTHRLYRLESASFHAWLYRVSGINPANPDFKYLLADCRTEAEDGELRDVIKVAHWDTKLQMLRVSRFDGQVYRLDGQTIEIEANGNGPALFHDKQGWITYEPDYSTNGTVADWTFDEVPHWDGPHDEYSLLLRVWWLTTFFTELCPTQAILLFKGEKGSGKSMTLRILLKMLFGAGANVSGMPAKEDGFVALMSAAHVVVIDNLDTMVKDIRDKIALITTGGTDHARKLYLTNEEMIITYRCWLAITSRHPDTLQRDDLIDRTIPLAVKRIGDAERARESSFLMETLARRNAWWGDTLLTLNRIVAEIRRGGVPQRSALRLADWEALGSVIAQTLGQERTWERAIKKVKLQQADFLLEDDPIVQGIDAWLDSPQYSPTPHYTRDLYLRTESALFGSGRPDASWPKSARSFGRRLAGMERELHAYLDRRGVRMTMGKLNGLSFYEFTR